MGYWNVIPIAFSGDVAVGGMGWDGLLFFFSIYLLYDHRASEVFVITIHESTSSGGSIWFLFFLAYLYSPESIYHFLTSSCLTFSPSTSYHTYPPSTSPPQRKMRITILIFSLILSATSILGHPAVSNPYRAVDIGTSDAEEDLYAHNPNERPLHTTVLMAMASARAERGRVPEL